MLTGSGSQKIWAYSREPFGFGEVSIASGPAHGAGGEVGSRINVIPESPLQMSFSIACKSSWIHHLAVGSALIGDETSSVWY